ncbi:VPA1262 family N-terminal domain-containing protein [Magnetospirillum fulvum]|uniref:Phospholipase D-like domain-containing protein n=1 Tax=Magnetospirillum fulvum TaxID=1082 RepID=A0A1H6JXI4_MAGFU|nr:VPA1262 family N-terminal domain-containing protein [Magnetospirillum fulvum]SEH67337.1 hypothetical protein SAMN04244559_03386 [Magnetospirillum fulvum]
MADTHPIKLPTVPDLSIPGDYGHACLHLAWYREDQERYLLFAMVELLPSEFPPPDSTEEQCLRTRSLGRRTAVYVRRDVLPATEALTWYEHCRDGHVRLPGSDVVLSTATLAQEPCWPFLTSTNNLPFHSWGTVRSHHLLQARTPDAAQRPLVDRKALAWLQDRLYFSLLQYGEWLGSINLVAPNPVLRAIHHTLSVDHQGEGSDFHAIVRQGHNISGLVLYAAEHRHQGVANLQSIPLLKAYQRIAHVGRTERVSLAVVCPQRGILEWMEPLPFLRTISISGSMLGTEKEVHVPDTLRRKGETYRATVRSLEQTSVMGEESASTHISTFLYSQEAKRRQNAEAERSGQKLFNGSPDEARDFVRQLIGRARCQVIIVDPYFATTELFAFALAITDHATDVTILTSSGCMRSKDQTIPDREAGEVLLHQAEHLGKQGEQLKIMVMGGDSAPIHDRFLVIDDTVWLSGNSLNAIGERAGLLMKVPAPGQITDLIEIILADTATKPLKLWVEERLAARKASERP